LAGLVMEQMELATGIAKLTCAFQATYWGTRHLSEAASPTYRSLDAAKGEKGYWAASVTGIIHAIVVTVLCCIAYWQEPRLFRADDVYFRTGLTQFTCQIFCGYTLSDFFLSVFFGSKWPGWQANLLHHVCVIAAWYMLALGGYFQGPATAAMVCEITTPFVNTRWVLDKAGLKNSNIYFWNGIIMLLLWFLFRVCLYGYQAVRLYQLRTGLLALPVKDIIVFPSCYFLGLLLQVFWFTKILKGAMKALGIGGKRKR